MAVAPTYGNRFTSQAMSLLGKTYVLYIKQKDYTGASTEVVASAIPFVRSMKGEADTIEDKILRSYFRITLEDQAEGTFRELFTYDWRKFIIEIWKDSTIYWVGYLTPDYYSEPWIEPPYSVSFEAHDGLGQLMNFDFINSLDDIFTGKTKLSDVVAQCLWKITPFYLDCTYNPQGGGGLLQTLIVYDGINIIEEHQDHAKSMLTENYLDAERFYQDETMNCYDALLEILKICNAQIFQQDGAWWIVSLGSRGDSFSRKKYTITETDVAGLSVLTWVLTTTDTYDPNKSVSSDTEPSATLNAWLDVPVMTILPAWKQFSVKQSLGYRSNLFDSTDYSVIGNPWIRVYQEGNVISYGDLGGGEDYTCPEHTILFKDDNKDKLIFDLGTFTKVDDQFFKVDIDFSKNFRTLQAEEDARVAIRMYIDSGTQTYWLNEDGSWHSSSREIFEFEFQLVTDGSVPPSYIIDVPQVSLPIAGNIFVEIQATNIVSEPTWLILIQNSCFKVEMRGLDIVESFEVITTINKKQNYIPETMDVIFGDLIDVDNKELLYAGGLYYLDGTYKSTALWHTSANTTLKPLVNLIADEIGVLHVTPSWMISGQMRGNLNPITCLTDTHADRKFIPIRFDEDCYNDEWDVDIVEIAPEEQAYLTKKQSGYLLLKGGGKIKLHK